MIATRCNGASAHDAAVRAMKQLDVIIIGAGILGTACAAALVERGMQVLVIEPSSHPGTRGATVAGMGHLVVMDDNPAELALTKWSCELWRNLVASAPAAHEYSQCGTLWVAQDEEEMQVAQAKQQLLAANGIASEMLTPSALAQREPNLASNLAGGLLVNDDAIVYAPKSALLLWQQAQASGRAAWLTSEVSALLEDGGVQLADGQILRATHVLVANGMGAAKLLPELPLRAKKGHIAITDRYPAFVRHQLVELGYIKSAHASDGDSVAFNLQPRPTGQVMIGSSRQYDQNDTSLDIAMLRKMLARCVEFVPSLAQLQLIRCWSGVRCASPDGLPLLGPHPSRPGVMLAVGHEGLGVTTALASAELIADHLHGQTSSIALAPYLPNRFTLRT